MRPWVHAACGRAVLGEVEAKAAAGRARCMVWGYAHAVWCGFPRGQHKAHGQKKLQGKEGGGGGAAKGSSPLLGGYASREALVYRRGQWDLSMKGALSMAKRTGSLVRGRRHKQSEVRGKKCCRCRGQGAKGQGEQPGGCVQNNQSEFMRAIVLCRATAGRLLREEGGLATQTGGRPVTAAGHLSRGSLPSGLSPPAAGRAGCRKWTCVPAP